MSNQPINPELISIDHSDMYTQGELPVDGLLDAMERGEKKEPDCSGHKREIAGISDMKQLAEMIGDLHYDSLFGLLEALYLKLESDSIKDKQAGRQKLASKLTVASSWIYAASEEIRDAYEISKPFMNQSPVNNK